MNTYTTALESYPLLTHVLTGGVLAVIGDSMAQRQEKCTVYNEKRAASFAAFDMTYRALQHYAFPWIISTFRGQYCMQLFSTVTGIYQAEGGGAATATAAVGGDALMCSAIEGTIVNQLGIVPILYYPLFFLLTALVQGMTVKDGYMRAKISFRPILQRHLIFWIPMQYLQFRYIEEDLQIPFTCLIGLGWTIILSLVAGNVKSPVVMTSTKQQLLGKRPPMKELTHGDYCKIV